MKQSLRTKLTISYLAVALLCVVLMGIISNLYLEREFRNYVKTNQEKKNIEIAALITHEYEMKQSLDNTAIQNIAISAMDNGLIVEILDAQDKVIWSALDYNHTRCQDMLADIYNNMMSRYPNWKGQYQTAEYPIMSNFKKAGTVKIGYYGPFYFTDSDLRFINSLNIVFVGVGAIALLLTIALGNAIARGISNPIKHVIRTAKGVSKGNYGPGDAVSSNIKEINSLTTSIHDMADILKQQELLRKKLTADVAHELRTPMATLQSHLEAMIDGVWEADEARLKSCYDEILRINRMVGDLEKLAKYEGENLVLRKEEFDITELIRNIAMNFEKKMLDKKIKFMLSPKPQSVRADRDKISQVIINLLSNAVKYSKEGGSVEISVMEDKDATCIKVKDSGIGIDKEHLEHVFERFYRVDSSRSRLTGGSGIGLTITKAIAEAHGGTIEVESEAGVGSVFTLKIPKI